MKRLLAISLCLLLCGCSGLCEIRKYDVVDSKPFEKEVDGEKVEVKLTEIREYKARNIKVKTDEEEEIETKNFELPKFEMPSKYEAK